jgi:hypothetical protein
MLHLLYDAFPCISGPVAAQTRHLVPRRSCIPGWLHGRSYRWHDDAHCTLSCGKLQASVSVAALVTAYIAHQRTMPFIRVLQVAPEVQDRTLHAKASLERARTDPQGSPALEWADTNPARHKLPAPVADTVVPLNVPVSSVLTKDGTAVEQGPGGHRGW